MQRLVLHILWRHDLFQLGNQLWQVYRQDLPEEIEINGVVAVNQSVAETDDLSPKDFWVTPTSGLRRGSQPRL
jgi:hypothetical protein